MKSSLKNTNVLVVDDDADICDLLRTALEGSGASVAVAQSVKAALETFRRCPPHVVIADIRLGNSDGYELIEGIRKCNEEYRGYTPLVAVTGFASPEDRERALAAGFGAYLSKPFDPSEVTLAVIRSLQSPSDVAA